MTVTDIPVVRPLQARSRETEQRLIGAALSLLSQGGLAACQIPDVARDAGVSVGAVYRRFTDKNALLTAAFRAMLDAQAQVEGAIWTDRACAAADLGGAIRTMVEMLVDANERGATIMIALQSFLQDGADSSLKDHVRDHRRRMLNAMAERLVSKAGADAPDDVRDRIRFALLAMSGTLNALLIQKGADSLGWDAPRDRVVDETTAMLVRYVVGVDKQG